MLNGVKVSSGANTQNGFTVSLSDVLEALLDSLPSPSQEIAQKFYANIHEAAKFASHSGILAYKADINMKDENGDTPLHIAVKNGKYATVTFLIENGANPELVNSLGQSAFHLAAVLQNTKMMELLYNKHNANIESCNNLRQTPLHAAIYAGHHNIVELLLKYNANIEVPNGESGIDIAEKCGRHDIENVLRLHKASSSSITPLYALTRKPPKKDESFTITKGVGNVVKRVLSGF